MPLVRKSVPGQQVPIVNFLRNGSGECSLFVSNSSSPAGLSDRGFALRKGAMLAPAAFVNARAMASSRSIFASRTWNRSGQQSPPVAHCKRSAFWIAQAAVARFLFKVSFSCANIREF
jgi:hypothetical protein